MLKELPDGCVDAIISDPPYPCVKRDYGFFQVDEWMELMQDVVNQSKRILTANGSAMFVLQPNSEHVGQMRSWIWDFMSWCCKEWNVVQDCYWWNFTMAPTTHVNRKVGLMRPSIKYLVWMGKPDCYRNQDDILWKESDSNKAIEKEDRALQYRPCGMSMRPGRCSSVAKERGGTTPFNLIPMSNGDSISSGGAKGHGAATPNKLCEWWVKYISKPQDIVLDVFSGSGSVPVAAKKLGRRFIGMERMENYCTIANERIARIETQLKF